MKGFNLQDSAIRMGTLQLVVKLVYGVLLVALVIRQGTCGIRVARLASPWRGKE